MSAKNKLTIKQKAFVKAYCGEAKGNATQAARLAGYKGNATTLQAVGCENLTKPLIKQAITTKGTHDTKIMSADEIRQWWVRYANGDAGTIEIEKEIMEINPVTKEKVTRTIIEKKKLQPSAAERAMAARDLARSKMMFVEKTIVEHDFSSEIKELLNVLKRKSVDFDCG